MVQNLGLRLQVIKLFVDTASSNTVIALISCLLVSSVGNLCKQLPYILSGLITSQTLKYSDRFPKKTFWKH